MGCITNISASEFPAQTALKGKRVRVCFHYNTEATVGGVVVRADEGAPHKTIIQLDDGRYVLSTECQYQIA